MDIVMVNNRATSASVFLIDIKFILITVKCSFNKTFKNEIKVGCELEEIMGLWEGMQLRRFDQNWLVNGLSCINDMIC